MNPGQTRPFPLGVDDWIGAPCTVIRLAVWSDSELGRV